MPFQADTCIQKNRLGFGKLSLILRLAERVGPTTIFHFYRTRVTTTS